MDQDTAGPVRPSLIGGFRRSTELWREDPAIPLGAAAGLVVTGFLISCWSRLNYDVSWLMVGASRLLEGSPLYGEDFIDVNPPLAVYIMTPAAVLVQLTDVGAPLAVTIQMWSSISLVLVICFRLLIRLHASADLRPTLWWLFGLCFVVSWMPALFLGGEAVAYAQREDWILLLILPFLFLTAIRMKDLSSGTGPSIAIGMALGIALCIKPHYLLTWAGLEGLLLLRRRRLSSLLRPESLAVVGTGLAYGAWLLVVTPGYLTVALPLALSSYWAYQTPRASLISLESLIAIAAALLSIRCTPPHSTARTLSLVFGVAAIGSSIAYLLGGTPWSYHALPFRSFIFLACLAPWIGRIPSETQTPLHPSKRLAHGTATFALVVTIAFVSPGDAGRILRAQGGLGSQGMSAQLATWLQRSEEPRTFAVLSTSVPPAFPAASYAEAEWSLRFSCLWPLAAILRSRYGSPEDRARLSPARGLEIEAYLRESIVSDFSRRPPTWVFVPQAGPLQGLPPGRWDLLNFLRSDPQFEAIWSQYRPAGRLGSLRVFARGLTDQNISDDASR
ncbi:MAG: hypothetical protein CBC48_14620 [bacterium TMED88]|nr:hypothetical protein [Deltaproteobacteria bacterium]OUV27189.1 MAG: hypothetical protein CBC48_14620 [bacterium TMED88]